MEVAAQQHFLGERDDVGRGGQVEVLMAPELARRSAPCLHLVDEKGRAMLHKGNVVSNPRFSGKVVLEGIASLKTVAALAIRDRPGT